MLFGSAVVVAILLSGAGESKSQRSHTHLWLSSDVRPKPLDLSPKPPLDLRSVKLCGASGLGAFVPLGGDGAAGVGLAYTTFRLDYTHRAAQVVLALRFRF